jgi:DNA adenine methylase
VSNDLFAQLMSLGQEDEVREQYVRAPFPWPGGKAKSIDNILPHIPYRDFYGEPFGGSGAILLARKPSNLEVYNDKFGGITCFYRVVRNKATYDQFMERLQLCQHSREEFIWSKKTWANCEDEIERAARWWYMVTCSFGGQGRNFGRATKSKAQFGPKLKNNLKLFHPVHQRLRDVQIENLDYRLVVKDYDSYTAVWYFDPPYYQVTTGQYECEFSDEEHKELLERVWQMKGFVAVSSYENPLYNKYPWTRKFQWKAFVTATALANTDTNNKQDQKRGFQNETLYIKDVI